MRANIFDAFDFKPISVGEETGYSEIAKKGLGRGDDAVLEDVCHAAKPAHHPA
jgi:hypothetical protein